jgi:acyl-CoA synthetase (AMP-forming)/AMP-acid ligase II
MVRGPWVVDKYFKSEGGDPLVKDAEGHGWFPTGDVAAIDASGFKPNTALEPAIIATLPQGAYTAIVEGVNGGTGVALVGVFTVP